MAEFDYALASRTIEQTLKDDARFTTEEFPVYVTRDATPPTAQQTPAVQIKRKQVTRTPWVMVGLATNAGQDKVEMQVDAICHVFSAQGTDDAEQQVDKLCKLVVDCLRDNPTLAGLVDSCRVTGVTWDSGQLEQSFYAGAAVHVYLLARA